MQHPRRSSIGIIAVALAAAFCCCGGCSSRAADDGIPAGERKDAGRMEQIARTSGGDWEKLSDSDRSFLNQMTGGDEKAARMMLAAKTGRLRGTAGGPVAPGSSPKPQ